MIAVKPQRLKDHINDAISDKAIKPLDGVASYSKILSMIDCTKYAIYDARVAACLNAVQLQMKCEKPVFFHYVASRNNLFKADKTARNFVTTFSKKELVDNRGWGFLMKDRTYPTYMALLHKLKEYFPGKEVYHFEMVLFTQALTLCPKLVEEHFGSVNQEHILDEGNSSKTYKQQIIDVINNLSEARNIMFGQVLNFAMQNEFSELNEAFDEGDTYNFSLVHFEDAKDVNLIKLIELCHTVETTVASLMNLNLIDEDEVDL